MTELKPIPDTDTSGKQPYQSGLLARIVAINFPRRVAELAGFIVTGSLNYGGSIKYQKSADGTSWQDQASPGVPPGALGSALAYGESTWILSGNAEGGYGVWRSHDLTNWESVYPAGFRSVAYGIAKDSRAKHGLFIGTDEGPNIALVSADLGNTWTTVALGQDLDANGIGMRASWVHFADGAFFIGSQAELNSTFDAGDPHPILWRSTDGYSWTATRMFSGVPAAIYDGGTLNYKPGWVIGVACNPDVKPKLFVAVGTMTTNGLDDRQPWLCTATSLDGIGWSSGSVTNQYVGPAAPFVNAAGGNKGIAFGNGKFVIPGGFYSTPTGSVPSKAVVLVSQDGSDWSEAFGAGTNAMFVSVGFSATVAQPSGKPGAFVVCGTNLISPGAGITAASADGTSWADTTSGAFDIAGSVMEAVGVGNISLKPSRA
jgi:hypothetical protein